MNIYLENFVDATKVEVKEKQRGQSVNKQIWIFLAIEIEDSDREYPNSPISSQSHSSTIFPLMTSFFHSHSFLISSPLSFPPYPIPFTPSLHILIS